MQKQEQQSVESFHHEFHLLEKISYSLHACNDLKELLIKVNTLQRAIFEEINRRTLPGCTFENKI